MSIMINNLIIGGEFEVNLGDFQNTKMSFTSLDGIYKYSTGRSALYHILLVLKRYHNISKILLPDYLCSSIVIASKKAGLDILFYPLDENLDLDKNKFANLYSEDCAILIINYFGLKNIYEQVSYIRSLKKEAIIIEDDVQAYYEFSKDLTDVDFKFTSLRKTFPCPDGGLVKTLHQLPVINKSNKFYQYKLAASILKSIRKPELYNDDVYLSLFEKGESMIDDDITNGISNISIDIFTKTDTERLAHIRRCNAKFICDGLRTLGVKTILPVPEDKTPLFVPIYLEERNQVRKYLFQHNCFFPIHWPLDGINVKKGAEMADHELSIIIDHRYTIEDMTYILNLIQDLI